MLRVRFIIVLALVLSTMLLGCGGSQPSDTKPPGFNSSEKHITLQGQSLQELGLDLEINQLKRFKDENGLLNDYYVLNYKRDSARAGMTGLLVGWSDASNEEVLIFMQGYKKALDSELEPQIVLESVEYPLADLVKHKLYEDDEVIVLDITDLLSGKKFPEQVQEWIDKGFSYQWLEQIWEYVRDYSHLNIIKRTVLEGKNLLDLSLDLDLSKLQRFENNDGRLTDYYVINYPQDSALAGMTGLLVGWNDGAEKELLILMQGFKKVAATEDGPYIEVDLRKYTLAELEQYKLYEDAEVIVLDITDVFSWDKYLDRVEEWIDQGYPYQWMLPIWDYVRDYSHIAIVRIDQ